MRDGVEVKEIVAPGKSETANATGNQGVQSTQDEAAKEAN